jgi:DUF4097 and DUF4098 domain-containing protein YvlB
MKRLTVNSIILLFLLSLVSGGCGGGGSISSSLFFVSEPFSFEVPEGSNTSLTVLGVNGIIEINGSAAVSTITISGVMKVGSASSADAKLHISDMSIAHSDSGGVVTVETVQPDDTLGINYIVEYSITVPDTMQVTASQANGEIPIQGMNSDIMASQANGAIEVDTIVPPSGSIDLTVGNGDISLLIPTDTSATLWCASATGRVRAYDLTISNPSQSSHFLSGTLGGGDGEINISTANGDITVWGI